MFTDTITIYNKISETEWKRTVIEGVQWSEKTEKKVESGKVTVAKYINITFPERTYGNLTLEAGKEEDCILYGIVEEEVTGEKGKRISDLLKKYPRSGRIRSVKNNSGRTYLKHVKVVLA